MLRMLISKLQHSTEDQTTEFLLSGDATSWDQVISFIKTEFLQVKIGWTPPFPGVSTVDTSRADKALGMEWRGMEEIFRETVAQQLAFQKK
jgi:hypothetical protein